MNCERLFVFQICNVLGDIFFLSKFKHSLDLGVNGVGYANIMSNSVISLYVLTGSFFSRKIEYVNINLFPLFFNIHVYFPFWALAPKGQCPLISSHIHIYSVYLSVCLSVCPSVHPSVRLSIHPYPPPRSAYIAPSKV
jgi:hypothetical protein